MQLIDLVATVPSLQTLDSQFLLKLRKVGESTGEQFQYLCDFFDQKSFFFSIVYVCMRVLGWFKKKKKMKLKK